MKNWLLAIRPKTLTIALAPVVLGLGFAAREGVLDISIALITALAALMIQIGTNLSNDYFDHQKGADKERVGPTRVTQAGLISPDQVKAAFVGAFALAVFLGLALVMRGGWPILLIGVLSVASGIAYTAGPYALAYIGLGEVFVLIFFGPVAVAGTYYLQTLKFSWQPAWAGVAIGLMACSILVVNNLRDLETDQKANKRTLAVRFGPNFAHAEYLFCLLVPAFIAFSMKAWVASLIILLAFIKLRKSTLKALLPQTAILLLIFSLVFAFEIVFQF
ncbi:MAG: 1,4-dihydroxy-2-naphthoate polyprenyltransferase [Deltaproteobacteria bacterium]|nr:1,4-dihydroxy-2-naphthoate polyprenyltransferase [Deltaproteobacteria bacterium]